MAHIGSWGLPELGITEKIQSIFTPNKAYAASGGSNLLGGQPAAPAVAGTSSAFIGPVYNGPLSKTTSYKTGGVGTKGGEPSSAKTTDAGYYLSAPQGESYDWEGAAQQGYESLMGGLNAIEEAYRAEYPVTEQQIKTEYGQSQAALGESKTTQLGELGEKRVEAGETAESGINAARKLYNELKQQRLAELSAGGLSSSSVAEAQMERLGRSVYGDISTQRQTLQKTLASIASEETKVTDFFTRKSTELEQNKNLALEQARIKFNQGLAEIAQMKGKAGAEYQQQVAQMRYQAMEQLRSESMQIQQFNAQMKLDLEKWAAQKQDALDSAKQKVYQDIAITRLSPEQLQDISGMGLSVTGYEPRFSGGQANYYPVIKKSDEEDTTTLGEPY